MITGGEDGLIKWWNVVYTPSMPSQQQLDTSIVAVNPQQVTNLKPAHEIYLSVSAQMLCVNIAKNILTICQSDGILSFYSCSYECLLEEEKFPDEPIQIV